MCASVKFRERESATPRSHRAATLRRSSRSSTIWKRLGSGRIGADRRLNRAIWQIVVFITTLLRCHYVKHAADQRPRLLRLRYAAATTFKILLRRYADLDDCTTISLRWCRSYYDCITLLVRFWRWCIYVLGLKHIFAYFQASKMNGRINADKMWKFEVSTANDRQKQTAAW